MHQNQKQLRHALRNLDLEENLKATGQELRFWGITPKEVPVVAQAVFRRDDAESLAATYGSTKQAIQNVFPEHTMHHGVTDIHEDKPLRYTSATTETPYETTHTLLTNDVDYTAEQLLVSLEGRTQTLKQGDDIILLHKPNTIQYRDQRQPEIEPYDENKHGNITYIVTGGTQ